jgi:predicted O-linked N-acetylglucosamine transferase (SPINDLY family)
MQSTVGSRAFQNARLQKKLKKQADALLPAATTAYRAGKHADAQALCRRLLEDLPQYADAMHLLGVSVLECGQFEEAKQILQGLVALDPGSADAHSNLGFALINLKRYDEARASLEKAVALRPNSATAQRNLGTALLHLELAEPAIAAFTRTINLKPDDADAWSNRGVAELMLRQWDAAAISAERALALQPRHADAHSNLGFALINLKRHDEARASLEKAVALQPNFATAQRNLGMALLCLELAEAAIAAFTRAINLKPDDADAWCNRGVAEGMLRRWDATAISAERALALQPRHFEALVNKGLAHLELRHFEVAEAAFNAAIAVKPGMAKVLALRGRLHLVSGRAAEAEADFDAAVTREPSLELGWHGKAQISMLTGNVAQAIVACKRVLAQNPTDAVGLTLLGDCLGRLGDAAAAIEHFDRALAIKPDDDEAISRKIFYQDFLSQADFADQQATRRYWWDAIGSKFLRRKLSPRSLDPDRRIVVGYVSSDFRTHSAAFAFLPVLRCHDKAKIQINGYSCSPARDQLTATFQSLADVWVDASALSDDELADRIQADGVDILVDLSGHTTGNRLTVFARKPAPIQVTAWGSGTGTGLATMDYFFADPVTIPQQVRHLFAEAVYDLPAVITIDPITDVTPSALPMLRNGFVTFGVFNRIEKISEEALAVWSKLLREIEGSKLVIKHHALDEAFLGNALVGRFTALGVAQDRITCIGATDRHDHLRAFEAIDISLDPFPQNGGISTWESLYAGVPVIAKLGCGASSRAAGAILSAIGLADWVADDDDGYVAIAKQFTSQPDVLAKLRAELPAQIAASPAGDVTVYTQRVEAGYRQFWHRYCAAASAAG